MKRIFIFSCFLLSGCIEEFIPETITFEDLLVVEATITDEFKFQEIKLSKTFRFEEEAITESLAVVKIIDDTQNIFLFNETNEPGKYVSAIMFSAEPNKNYTLRITTKNNTSFTSSSVKLPSNSAKITNVSYIKAVNSGGVEGINILIDSFDPSGNSLYYRYEFEETQRIIAPFWGPQEIIIISDAPPFKVGNIPNTKENRVCYKTTISNSSIVQTQTNNLFEDRVTKFPVKFLSKNDSIIRDRYSILVKQHVQSLEAYTYFQTLNKFSNSESILSENQPGFLEGNIFSDTNPSEKVLGFFEISSVSLKRLFLNFKDVFPNENKLPYFSPCNESEPYLTDLGNSNFSPLIDLLKKDKIRYWQINEDFFGDPIENPPYKVYNRECSDCTFYGTNVKPNFWVD